MKIIQINNIYPSSSTGKIVNDLDTYYIAHGIESIVIYGHGPASDGNKYKVTTEPYMKLQALRSRLTGVMYGGCLISTNETIKIIKKEKPDVVHVHCINGNCFNIYKLFTWLRKNKINTVLTNHAEFIYTGNCGHALDCDNYLTGCGKCPRLKQETKSWFFDGTHKSWFKMQKAFDGFETLEITNVSPWLTERSKGSVILGGYEQTTVLNGINTNVFTYKNNYVKNARKTIFQATANFSDNPIDIKGGTHIIELAKRMPDVVFVIAGRHPENLSVPSNVKLLGVVKDQGKLADLYSQADLVVLTSKKETFSMVVAEALCCGTPVVGFKAGAPEMITIEEYSQFVEQGDIGALERAVREYLNKEFDKAEISRVAKGKYSKEKMAEEYLKVYRSFMIE